MNHIQDEINTELNEIQAILHQQNKEPPTYQLRHTPSGQQQHPRYDEKYQLALLHSNSARETTSMDKNDVVDHIICGVHPILHASWATEIQEGR